MSVLFLIYCPASQGEGTRSCLLCSQMLHVPGFLNCITHLKLQGKQMPRAAHFLTSSYISQTFPSGETVCAPPRHTPMAMSHKSLLKGLLVVIPHSRGDRQAPHWILKGLTRRDGGENSFLGVSSRSINRGAFLKSKLRLKDVSCTFSWGL